MSNVYVGQGTAGQIYSLIPKVMEDIGAVAKTRKNKQQDYQFRGIEDFYQAAHPAMIKHGVFCAPEVMERSEVRFEKVNYEGKVTSWIHVALKVCHRFYASDGSFVAVTTCGEGLDNSDKASNKAMSGAMKYALIELFCVPTQDVEDSDRESPETGVKKPEAKRTTEPVPVKRPAKKAAAPVEEPPPYDDVPPPDDEAILPPKSALVAVEDAQYLHKRFREALRPDIQREAEKLLHDWLGTKLYLDEHGNPSAKAIRKDEFKAVGKAAVEYAKML